jgi:tripartite-type tricarboxylate transporter receptor subunit TctC
MLYFLRSIRVVAATAVFAALPMPVLAQQFPSAPIRIVLSYAAREPTDFLARLVGEKVSWEKLSEDITCPAFELA